MKIVKHGKNEHWICNQEFVALVSYETIIALQSIDTSELIVTRDKLSMSSKKHLNHLIATCPNYTHTELSQRDLTSVALDKINDTDNDPITSDDNTMYTLSAILSFSDAQELLEQYHGIDMLSGRYKTNQLYKDNTIMRKRYYMQAYNGNVYIGNGMWSDNFNDRHFWYTYPEWMHTPNTIGYIDPTYASIQKEDY